MTGQFTAVSGVKEISTAGGGLAGPNQFSLQLNTNFSFSTQICGNRRGCSVWQQYIYATGFPAVGQGAIFMEYWLFYYGSSCPSGWMTSGQACYRNSPITPAPVVPVSDLAKVTLSGAAYDGAGAYDYIQLQYGDDFFSYSDYDSIAYISQGWTSGEFNIFGNGGGGQAVFNPGSSLTAKVGASYPSYSQAPTCGIDGTTGETNNLNLSNSCPILGYSSSDELNYMQFSESN